MVIGTFLLLCLTFLMSNDHSLALTKGDKNVCTNESTGALFCCFNYEMINGQCVECTRGYTSKAGEMCMPCGKEHFGYRCLLRCKCESHQMCDPVEGCIEITGSTFSIIKDSSGDFVNISTVRENWSTNVGKDVTMLDIDMNEEENSINTDEVKVGIPVGLLMLYIIIMHILCLIMYKKWSNRGNILRNENAYDEIGTVHYNAVLIPPIIIHESFPDVSAPAMVHHLITSRNDLEISSEKTGTSTSSESNSIVVMSDVEQEAQVQENPNEQATDGYEHPYTPMVSTNQDEHNYSNVCITSELAVDETQQTENATHADYVNLRV